MENNRTSYFREFPPGGIIYLLTQSEKFAGPLEKAPGLPQSLPIFPGCAYLLIFPVRERPALRSSKPFSVHKKLVAQ